MAGLEFRLLGPVEARHGGRVLEPTTAQQRCVLAALLLDLGRVVSADRLTAALWPAEPPRSAQNTLRVYVTRLRRLLAADPSVRLETVGSGWRLSCARDRVDLYRFRDLVARARGAAPAEARGLLAAALALWRGPALADLPAERWRGVQCAALEEERLAAVEDRVACGLAAGEAGEAVPELSALLAEHPTRERLALLLMSALDAAGRGAEAVETFHRTRTVLREELGVDPGPELQREFQRLLAAPGGRRGEPVPRQLPGDLAAFAGRADAIARLDELLERSGGAAFAVALDGLPGVGKTTLAVRWAHRVEDRFPDGTLYANLRGFGAAGPRDPAEVLQEFLHALGVPAARVPTGLDARAAHFRSVLAGRRLLLVLDDVRDEAQVRPLLPSAPGCAAVLTGRAPLTGLAARQGVLRVRVEPVGPSEALDLLARRLGERVRGDAAAERIIAGCAGLPLALSIVAARADESPFALAAVAGELETAALDAFADLDADTDLRTVFSWSYGALGPAAARLFRLLGLHWGPDFTVEAAASLAAVPVPEARRLVMELRRMQLLGEAGPGRFGFHDLLAAYAAELAAAEESEAGRREALRRLLDHYLHGARRGADLLNQFREPGAIGEPAPGAVPVAHAGRDAAMAWFDREHPVLTAAVAAARDRGFDSHAWLIAWSLMPYLRKQGLGTQWIATAAAGVAAATRAGDAEALAMAVQGLAAAHTWYGDRGTARRHLAEALRRYEALGQRVGQASVHSVMCKLAAGEEDFAAALPHAVESLRLYREAGAAWGEARALNNVGYCLARLGELGPALRRCEEAIAVFAGLDDPAGAAGAWESLGLVHSLSGRHDRAAECMERSSAASLACGEKQQAAVALIGLGENRLATEDRDAAARAWEAAVRLLEELRDPGAAGVRERLAALRADREAAVGRGPGGRAAGER
ncbi:AfsR/SARP family transcriptional regulator [Glycomyces terrestris]|uniref:OmpR/PhoB-type domain-containing protein n=1 Tax=Glycomyces terrestris TaxID=2493553 RepID=A0A426UV19_9ACTN|nr:AfsR/SARP family transcriptional regulator [Glycomyces terrestris]RRR98164.1 hypothetical protein EIW28_14690 [Glycomyces terrestris]